MTQRDPTDYPIDPVPTSGTDLAELLNRSASSWDTSNSGATRPVYLEAGGIWLKTDVTPHELYMYDATDDLLLATIDFTTNEVNFASSAGDEAIAAHIAEADPHPQYLTPAELPSTVVSWYTDNISTIDGAFLASVQDPTGEAESTVSGSATSNGTPVLLAQFMRETLITSPFVWYETNTTLQLDLDCSGNDTEIWAVIGLRKADTSLIPLSTSDRIPLENDRRTYTVPMIISGPINIEAGDTTYFEFWIEKSGGGNKTVTIYMEGNDVSRAVTSTPIATFPSAHAATHEVGGSDLVLHNNLTGATGQKTHSEIDNELNEKTRWLNTWYQKEYQKNDMVRDGDWTMIANKVTSERPAPQVYGDPVYGLPETPSWVTQSSTSVVYSGHVLTFARGGWLKEIRVAVPEVSSNIKYRILVIDETDPANLITRVITNPTFEENSWTTAVLGSAIIKSGTILRVLVDSLNSSGDTLLTGSWAYDGTSNNSAPATYRWNTNNFQSILRIDKTDLDSTDRSSDLLSATIDSTIRLASNATPSTYEEYLVIAPPTDQGTHIEYEVSLTSTSGTLSTADVCNLDFTIPIPQPTGYLEIDDYWTLNTPDYLSSAVGFVWFDGVPQAGNDSNAYAIDLKWQDATVSEDWDLVALSEGTSSGGGSGGGATILDELGDVTITTPAEGEVLIYNELSSQWENNPNNIKRAVLEFTNVAGQSAFAVDYFVGLLDVEYNGVKLLSTDFTATDGSNVTLVEPVLNPDHSVVFTAWGKDQP